MIDINERNKLMSVVNFFYVEIKYLLFDKIERFWLVECFSGDEWILKIFNFLCVIKRDIDFIYRDFWEK